MLGWFRFATICIVLTGLAFGSAANAADVTVLCSNALQSVLTELTPKYEESTGDKLIVTYASSVPLKARIEDGAAFDVTILTTAMIDELVKAGKIAADPVRMIARSDVGIAVLKGSQRPDISTPEKFRATMLATPSLASTSAGQSRVGLLAALDKLGIAADVNAKTKIVYAGSAGEALLRGEAVIAVQLIPELMAVPGLDVVGPFPAALQNPVLLTAGINVKATRPERARSLVAFLSSPDIAPVIRSKGLTPG